MTEQAFPPGAAKRLVEQAYGGPTRDTEEALAVGTGATSVSGANPERVQLTFINLSTVDIHLATRPTVTALNGIPLAAGGGSVTLIVPEDGFLPTLEWFAIAGAASSTLLRIEVLRETISGGAR